MKLPIELAITSQSAIEIRVDDNTLVLRGERKLAPEVRQDQYHRSERPHGPFVRSFTLPQSVDQGAIRASHVNGVLELVLPKRQESKSKSIRVDVQ